jgi:hypothetical protein
MKTLLLFVAPLVNEEQLKVCGRPWDYDVLLRPNTPMM